MSSTLPVVGILLIMIMMMSLALVVVLASSPPSRNAGGYSFSFDTPWYHIRVTNKTNATIAAEYARPNPNVVTFLSSPFGAGLRKSTMDRANIPVWERSPASDYDDRITWSPLMDNFSMPFFEQRLRHGSSSNSNQQWRSGASAFTFHVSSNGFLTPSVDGFLCGSGNRNYFCADYYFPSDRTGRTVQKEFDIVPTVALLIYDLDPTQSPSPHPISIFLHGDCADADSAGWTPIFTGNAYACESIVFDIDRVPMFRGADQLNNSAPYFSAQAQLFRNGTVVMRYLNMPPVSPEPWWYLPFNIDKVHPSCGMINHNMAQVANVSEYCGDATPGHGGAPLYSEFVFTPRDLAAEKQQRHQAPYPGPPCEQRANCSHCAASSACVWCEGAPPQTAEATRLTASGRCIPSEMEEGICGATPDLTVRGGGGGGSLPNTTVLGKCDMLAVHYARTQQPYRSAWFSSEVGLNLPEWRDGGAWADASGPTVLRTGGGAPAEAGNGQSIGPRTHIPTWHRGTDAALARAYGSVVQPSNHSAQTTWEQRTVRAGSITAKQLVPSAWWIHNIDLAGGNRDQVLSCSLGVNALSPESIIACDQLQEGSDSARNTAMRINIFNLRKHLWPDNVTVVSVPGVEFNSGGGGGGGGAPPHSYCIRRRCGDAPSLMQLGMCSAPDKMRCDAFTMLTWRGQVLPATNGTMDFTLSVAIGEFGHIVANVDLASPLGLSVPAVLPKHIQHFYMDYPGGDYSAPMRRWAGSGLSTVMAPVTSCPRCPIGSTCDAVRGTCNCLPQFDDAKMCTVCRPEFIQRHAQVQEPGLSAPTLGIRCVQCPPCKNGGRCNNVTGTCVCPQPYDGDLCDVKCPAESALAAGQRSYRSAAEAAPLLTKSRAECLRSGRGAWLCGKCHYPPAPPLPPVPYERPFWVYFLGWTLMFVVIFIILYVVCRRMLRCMLQEEGDGYHGDHRRRRPRRGEAGSSSSSNRRRRSDAESYSDDDDDYSDRYSDEEYEDEFAADEEMMTASHHQSGVDEHLRTLAPRAREQHLLPMLERARGTPSEAVWQRRLDEAKREMQRHSNPLGIAIPVASSNKNNNNNNAASSHPIPVATVVVPAPPAGRSGLSSSSSDDDDNDDDDDAGTNNNNKNNNNNKKKKEEGFLPPIRSEQSTSAYKLDDDDDDDDAAGRNQPGPQLNLDSNKSQQRTSSTAAVVRANPLAPTGGGGGETVVAGKLIGLDDL